MLQDQSCGQPEYFKAICTMHSCWTNTVELLLLWHS